MSNMTAIEIAATDGERDQDACGTGVISGRSLKTFPGPYLTSCAAGKIQINTAELQQVFPDVRVLDSWYDSKYGNMCQLEAAFYNKGTDKLRGFRMDISPSGSVVDLWNMRPLTEDSYALAGWWTNKDTADGIPPGDAMTWGGLFKDADEFEFKLSPYASIP